MRKILLKEWNIFFVWMQQLARSLLIPLTVMALIVFMSLLGNYIELVREMSFYLSEDLPVVFAAGVAMGLAKEKRAMVGIGSIICYILGKTELTLLYVKDIVINPFYGILCGILAAVLFNKYKNVILPDYLNFISGDKFALLVIMFGSLCFNLILWPVIEYINTLGITLWDIMLPNHVISAFIYGILNRLFVPIGLHHLLNNFICTQTGQFGGTRGEIMRFLAGDPQAGYFMGGFYPIVIFGLPAAALAMYLRVSKDEKKNFAKNFSLLIFMTMCTGITEPLEFMFMFTSPMLYVVHAILTGISYMLASYFHIRTIYSFSTGLFDFFIELRKKYRCIHTCLYWNYDVYNFIFLFFIFQLSCLI